MRAYKPEKEPRYRVGREGIPQPKGERHELPALSVTVVDWVTNERLWEAEIINKKPKSQDAEPSPGPETQVYARGLKPDQLAQKLTRKLRDYVETLEKAEGSKATPNQKAEIRKQKLDTTSKSLPCRKPVILSASEGSRSGLFSPNDPDRDSSLRCAS